MDLGDPAWDRLWNVAQDTGLPISVHIKGGSWSGLSYQIGKWQAAAFATIMPLQLDEILATLIFAGILERHPGLQIVMAESGVSWLPFFLARADMEWNDVARASSTTRQSSRRVSCSPARSSPRSRRSSSPSRSPSSVPTGACGRRTTRTPTARSPSRGA